MAAAAARGALISTESRPANPTRNRVGGMRSARMSVTGRRCRMESPRSPRVRFRMNTPYWTKYGSSSSRYARSSAIFSSLARVPSMIAAGSPGTNRTRKKMKSVIRNSTGTI